jgi:hypothetical protein
MANLHVDLLTMRGAPGAPAHLVFMHLTGISLHAAVKTGLCHRDELGSADGATMAAALRPGAPVGTDAEVGRFGTDVARGGGCPDVGVGALRTGTGLVDGVDETLGRIVGTGGGGTGPVVDVGWVGWLGWLGWVVVSGRPGCSWRG